MLGTWLGQPAAGAAAGTSLGAAISRWLGSGDYSVSANTITQRVAAGNDVPAMHKTGQSIVVRHKEFVSEVTGSQAFTVQGTYPINPGLDGSFPWLSSIASQYSEYRIKGLVYHYIPTSGDSVSSTNPALGTVMMQTSYRSTETTATSKLEMLNEYWASEGKPSEAFCHPIECDPKENPFQVQYVRSGALPSTENALLYDLGRLTIATSGQQTTGNVVGDLWVTYEIELRKPVLTGLNGTVIRSALGLGAAGFNIATPFGTDFGITQSAMGGPITVAGNVITFGKGNVGTYLMCVTHGSDTTPTSQNIVVNTITASGGVSLAPNLGSGTSSRRPNAGLSTSAGGSFVTLVSFTMVNPNVAGSLTFGFGQLVNVIGCAVNITELNPTIS